MSTMAQTKAETHTVTATDIREVAAAISKEIIALYEFYGRRFPYNVGKTRNDIGLLLLFAMTDRIVVEFYEMVDNQKVERLSYTYRPEADPEAVDSPPGEFPRYEIDPAWQVRVVSYYSTTKPVSEVREFHNQLGWHQIDRLTRTGGGTTERYGAIRYGGYEVTKEVYHDLQEKHHTDKKELDLYETI
jgi:hypothetical protein